ncbi:hypothetical protein [Planktothrix agardhii]|jgi:hypothetical protein|uniref:Uncharacterized protein n=1 Tax=Planktothrix agardhii TaxID=1160 RepID=A0AAD1Q6G8_PLAAG|nr:hypothetical protein [Planktothrix agardhii]MCB8766507.1 hypothetical protein [Planktothrix agardhii 1809]MCB8780261.1 hypothetical protein [Planktothrix agardhii 1031]MCB8784660.1 hypothetical protein [Planktothrix agardhii 1808]MCB8789013.1 hypothetical protein [Planktothrix agardhii 1025]MCF3568953.1 hypothetical protein [Planktothrix agardhii 1807]
MSIYFGLAISSTMFPKECVIVRKEIDSKSPNNILKSLINASIIICDPFHKRIINILESRFSLNIDVPARRPIINLKNGDILIIAEVSGLPSFTHKYSQAEIDGASIIFVQHKIHTGVVHEAEETTIKEDEYFA